MHSIDPDRVAATVRDYIVANFLFGEDGGLGDEDSLIDAGAIDSTGVVELVSFLEERFGIEVQDRDLVPENLDSIGRIARFVGRCTAGVETTSAG